MQSKDLWNNQEMPASSWEAIFFTKEFISKPTKQNIPKALKTWFHELYQH